MDIKEMEDNIIVVEFNLSEYIENGLLSFHHNTIERLAQINISAIAEKRNLDNWVTIAILPWKKAQEFTNKFEKQLLKVKKNNKG